MALLVIAHRAHGNSIVEIAGLILFFIALRCSAMDLSHLEAVLGEAVRDSLRSARITEDVAAELMLMDVAAFRRCLRGESRLQLGVARLMRLPFVFWLHFSPTLMYLVAKQNITQIADDFGLNGTKS